MRLKPEEEKLKIPNIIHKVKDTQRFYPESQFANHDKISIVMHGCEASIEAIQCRTASNSLVSNVVEF